MQNGHSCDRRQFVGTVASGVFAAGLMANPLSVSVQDACTAETSPAAQTADLQATSDIFPSYQELLVQRVAETKRRIARAIAKSGARPVMVGVFQMQNHCNGTAGKDRNLHRMVEAIEFARSRQVQVLVFPEMCLPGYFTGVNGTPEAGIQAAHTLADTIGSSQSLETLRQAAAQANMVIVFGFCERAASDKFYNSAAVIDADGRWLGVRRKNPLYPYPYETGPFVEPPREQRSAVFQTKFAKVGVSICFDGEFPETVRRMRLDGAEMLLWSNAALGSATLGTTHRQNAAGFHAQANGFWVACCNCAAPNSSGMSSIYAPSGEPLVILPPSKELLGVATIELTMSADWSVWKDRLAFDVRSQTG